ncbi:MAG: alanine dehydrogenase [Alphaproteobacteria bacterium]|nr:alanine dehydrogenase [Alphaproteobacteria bacterium]
MLIGVPKESKVHEYRIGLVPMSVSELTYAGHEVIVETGAGCGAGLTDECYIKAGARIASGADEIFSKADMIIKVKEPLADECKKLREGQVLFTYLHLAPDEAQTRALLESGAICIAYETVTNPQGSLPLLTPMSEIAGRLSPQVGSVALQKNSGGSGILLAGALGVPAADVVVLGGGVAGSNAAMIALGMGASVTVVDCSAMVLASLSSRFGPRLRTIFSTHEGIAKIIQNADLVIGTVLIPGATAPRLLTADMIRSMKDGAVFVDVSIDQGGCSETSRATTYSDPTYIVDGVVHYCVSNMPGAVARTSAFSLNNMTLPFIKALADKGYLQAFAEDPFLRKGLNVYRGDLTIEAVAFAHGLDYTSAEMSLGLN